jgi:iron(III) transport system permease protein
MATAYIIGRVENNDYGLAIAYSTVLIFVMLTAVVTFQLVVGERKLGRRVERGQAESVIKEVEPA